MLWRKYILLCLSLLLCFIFGISINTECKAYTTTELEQYLNYFLFDSGDTIWNNSAVLRNLVTLKNQFPSKYNEIFSNTNLNHDNLAIFCNTNGAKWWIIIFWTNYGYSYDISNNKYSSNVSFISYTYQNGSWSMGNSSNYAINYDIPYVFITTSTNWGNTFKTYFETNKSNMTTQWNYMFNINRSNQTITTNGNQYTTAFDIRIGQDMAISNIEFKVFTLEENIKTYREIQTMATQATGTKQYIISLLSENLDEDNTYYLECWYNGLLWNTSPGQRIRKTTGGDTPINSGTITNQSGDVTGNIDLTGIENRIDNVDNHIQTLPVEIGKTFYNSGDSGEKGIIQKVYEDLFTISGDYINQKFEEIRQEYNISGDYELEQAFIEQIQENADDFIISWQPVETHFTFGNYEKSTKQILFPSGEINFSKMERENEDLHNTMVWARTIIGFSLGLLLLRNYWTTLLLMLGIGIQVYDKEDTEKQAVTTQTITIDAKGNKTLTETTKKGNFTIRRVKK